MAMLRRISILGAMLVALAGCALDKPDSARALADRWLHVDAQTYFTSRSNCTVAVYRLSSGGLRSGAARVFDLRQGLVRLRAGQAVAFAAGVGTPDAVSQAIMSTDLPLGLGMLSSVMGPRDCMTDEVAQGVSRMLTAQGVITVYDPAQNIVILLDGVTRHAILMRGTV